MVTSAQTMCIPLSFHTFPGGHVINLYAAVICKSAHIWSKLTTIVCSFAFHYSIWPGPPSDRPIKWDQFFTPSHYVTRFKLDKRWAGRRRLYVWCDNEIHRACGQMLSTTNPRVHVYVSLSYNVNLHVFLYIFYRCMCQLGYISLSN